MKRQNDYADFIREYDRDGTMSANGPNQESICVQHKAPAPLGAYSHVVKAGPFIFTCGLGARSPETGTEVGLELNESGGVLHYDIQAQTRQVLENLIIVLQEVNCTLKDVVDVTVFLAHMDDFSEFNQTYAHYFNFDNPPARTTVQAQPPGRNFVEIKAIAYKP
jgi:2-aminomuconate deaminase